MYFTDISYVFWCKSINAQRKEERLVVGLVSSQMNVRVRTEGCNLMGWGWGLGRDVGSQNGEKGREESVVIWGVG